MINLTKSSVEVPMPSLLTIVKWVWNIICIAAIGTCIYFYIQIQPMKEDLKSQRKEHEVYRDSMETKLNVLEVLIKDKENNVKKIDKELDKSKRLISKTEEELLKLITSMDAQRKQRESVLAKGDVELSDDDREIFLKNKFPRKNK